MGLPQQVRGEQGRPRLPGSRIPIPAEFPGLHHHLPGCPGIMSWAGTCITMGRSILERNQHLWHPTGTPRVTGTSAPVGGKGMEMYQILCACTEHTAPALGRPERPAECQSSWSHTTQLTRDCQLINADIELFRPGVALASWNWSDRSETKKKVQSGKKNRKYLDLGPKPYYAQVVTACQCIKSQQCLFQEYKKYFAPFYRFETTDWTYIKMCYMGNAR